MRNWARFFQSGEYNPSEEEVNNSEKTQEGVDKVYTGSDKAVTKNLLKSALIIIIKSISKKKSLGLQTLVVDI